VQNRMIGRVLSQWACLTMAFAGGQGLAASDGDASCLSITSDVSALPDSVRGTASNGCSKSVTAYSVTLVVVFQDGASDELKGTTVDYLMGLGGPPGVGALAVGESRQAEAWGIPLDRTTKAAVRSASARVTSVIFDDASVAGDAAESERVFVARRYALREWQFWQGQFSVHREELGRQGPLSRLIELADLPGRRRMMMAADRRTRPGDPRAAERASEAVESHANMIGAELRKVDQLVQQGVVTRADAMQHVHERLSALVDSYGRHSERRAR